MAEATRIQKYIERIDYVELGFTLKRYFWPSVEKSINVIHHLTQKKRKIYDHLYRYSKNI